MERVVMEATGNYWVVFYTTCWRQRICGRWSINPRYAKNMSGRKGDIADCQWMQKLHTYGLFANWFRPTEPIRVLRTYLRHRETLVQGAAQEIEHMHKALTEMNVQLANRISDISAESGLRIIDAILRGQRDPQGLAALKDRRIRVSQEPLAQALEGHWKPEQLFILEQARLSYAHYQEQLAQTEQRVSQQMQVIQSRVVEGSGATKVVQAKSLNLKLVPNQAVNP